jgi:thioredoxin-related protein
MKTKLIILIFIFAILLTACEDRSDYGVFLSLDNSDMDISPTTTQLLLMPVILPKKILHFCMKKILL